MKVYYKSNNRIKNIANAGQILPSDTLISHTLESSFGKWGVTSEFLEQSRQYLQTQTGIVPDVHDTPTSAFRLRESGTAPSQN